MNTMMRVRLKADGRIVEILPDGTERELTSAAVRGPVGEPGDPSAPGAAAYARGVRAQTKLTQAEFASRIGVPSEEFSGFLDAATTPSASLMIRMRRLSDRFAKMRAHRTDPR